jgi:hypothetical protein
MPQEKSRAAWAQKLRRHASKLSSYVDQDELVLLHSEALSLARESHSDSPAKLAIHADSGASFSGALAAEFEHFARMRLKLINFKTYLETARKSSRGRPGRARHRFEASNDNGSYVP